MSTDPLSRLDGDDRIAGTVESKAPDGLKVRLEGIDDAHGWLPLTSIPGDEHERDLFVRYVGEGDPIRAWIVSVDTDARTVELTQFDPMRAPSGRYFLGVELEATVTGHDRNSVEVELSDGTEAVLPLPQLSWDERPVRPGIGESFDVVVIEPEKTPPVVSKRLTAAKPGPFSAGGIDLERAMPGSGGAAAKARFEAQLQLDLRACGCPWPGRSRDHDLVKALLVVLDDHVAGQAQIFVVPAAPLSRNALIALATGGQLSALTQVDQLASARRGTLARGLAALGATDLLEWDNDAGKATLDDWCDGEPGSPTTTELRVLASQTERGLVWDDASGKPIEPGGWQIAAVSVFTIYPD